MRRRTLSLLVAAGAVAALPLGASGVPTAPAAPPPAPVVAAAPATASAAAPTLWLPSPDPRPVWRGAPIDLSLKDADLREVLRSFAKLARMNLVLHPTVKGKVTVELQNVPWDQALHVILKTHGLAAEVDGTIWSVRSPRR
jgi:type IV pilus assembly protein PilQ